ncbi:MAG: hypothetical protein M3O74_10540 [Pseudomonadota bacterium]|nr:hypothetical protein [Pseudomonadota bacterium]
MLAISSRTTSIALIAALSLAACGGSPSESDVRAALIKQLDASQEQTRQIAGKNAFMDSLADEQRNGISQLKLVGCKSDGEKSYLCDIAGKAGAMQLRMLKGPDGWIAAEAGKG